MFSFGRFAIHLNIAIGLGQAFVLKTTVHLKPSKMRFLEHRCFLPQVFVSPESFLFLDGFAHFQYVYAVNLFLGYDGQVMPIFLQDFTQEFSIENFTWICAYAVKLYLGYDYFVTMIFVYALDRNFQWRIFEQTFYIGIFHVLTYDRENFFIDMLHRFFNMFSNVFYWLILSIIILEWPM